ncbi:MAG: hypothetical protein AB7E52_05235 [Bdellovibrionales bacterium]
MARTFKVKKRVFSADASGGKWQAVLLPDHGFLAKKPYFLVCVARTLEAVPPVSYPDPDLFPKGYAKSPSSWFDFVDKAGKELKYPLFRHMDDVLSNGEIYICRWQKETGVSSIVSLFPMIGTITVKPLAELSRTFRNAQSADFLVEKGEGKDLYIKSKKIFNGKQVDVDIQCSMADLLGFYCSQPTAYRRTRGILHKDNAYMLLSARGHVQHRSPSAAALVCK